MAIGDVEEIVDLDRLFARLHHEARLVANGDGAGLRGRRRDVLLVRVGRDEHQADAAARRRGKFLRLEVLAITCAPAVPVMKSLNSARPFSSVFTVMTFEPTWRSTG